MKRHEEPNLCIPNPLPDAIPCAPLHARNERAVVDDAVEYLADRLRGSGQVRLRTMLGDGALARSATHLAGGARGLWRRVRLWCGCCGRRQASERVWERGARNVRRRVSD